MITVGIRELKNRLSEYLRLVRAGALVQVTAFSIFWTEWNRTHRVHSALR